MAIASIVEVLEDLRHGKMIILVDDEDRENEGDLVIAAEKVTPDAINFMAKYGRGLICLAMAPEMVDRLALPQMVADNTSPFETAFTVSIEAREGVTTGISAFDRAHTVLTAVADDAKPVDLIFPGHIFPLRAKEGVVLRRTGQTEGSVDLATLAGLKPAAVICEILKKDGEMARMPDLEIFAREHDIKILTVANVVAHRIKTESFVTRAAETVMPTNNGKFRVIVYVNELDRREHLALIKGNVGRDDDILVRVHSECLTGDALGSVRCDCGDQLAKAMSTIEEEGRGIVIYLRQEGRGIGLVNKLKAYALQDRGRDTVEANEELGFEADLRDYGVGAQMLADLGVKKMRLMTNNPKKLIGLSGYDLEITERIPINTEPRAENIRYMATKHKKLGHLLNF